MIIEAAGPVKYAVIEENTAASNEIVAAVASRKLRVLGGVFCNNDTTNDVKITFEDEDGVNIIGPITLAAREKFVLVPSGLGYGETPVGKALHLLQDGTEVVAGSLTYQEVK